MELTSGNGSLYKVYDTNSQEYLFKRLPRVGEVRIMEDGRRFRFISTTVNAAVGQMLAAPAALAELAAKITAALQGDESIIVEKSGVTANAWADGFITITSGTTETTYRITRNTASDGSNKVTVYLEVPLAAAIAGTEDCIIVLNKFSSCIIGTATCIPVGVAIMPSTAATDSRTNYMWVQTHGYGGVLITTASGITVGVTLKPIAAGGFGTHTAGTPLVATAANIAVVSDGDVAPAFICIE